MWQNSKRLGSECRIFDSAQQCNAINILEDLMNE